jgi:hypothetical protein
MPLRRRDWVDWVLGVGIVLALTSLVVSALMLWELSQRR